MRVSVTSATGFIGSTVAKELLNSGHDVAGTARSQESAQAHPPLRMTRSRTSPSPQRPTITCKVIAAPYGPSDSRPVAYRIACDATDRIGESQADYPLHTIGLAPENSRMMRGLGGFADFLVVSGICVGHTCHASWSGKQTGSNSDSRVVRNAKSYEE
jgi:NAD(P)-dependent dehydrogenase (short-subunit alcohol dehydrogenase family)